LSGKAFRSICMRSSPQVLPLSWSMPQVVCGQMHARFDNQPNPQTAPDSNPKNTFSQDRSKQRFESYELN
jgi:hypothetical protein